MACALIVEDEPAIRRMIDVIVRGMGFETVPAADAERAEEILEAGPPDVVITDVKLPGKDGVELVHEMRGDPRVKDVPVIMLSAYGEPRAHEANVFIAKPFDIDVLVDAVARLAA